MRREPSTGAPPRTAIIVPAYQAECYIGATLHSLQEQTVQDWECIVVDDGSSDATAHAVAEIGRQDPRLHLVRQDNKGLSGARNTGLTQISASVRYIAFIDADDTWCSDALERLIETLERHPTAAAAYGYAELMDEQGDPIATGLHPARQRDRRRVRGLLVRRVARSEPVHFDEWVVGGPVWPPAVALHRREVVVAAGAFDTDLRQLEDWDFYIRSARHGYHIPFDRQVAWYRQHPQQMTNRRVEFWYSHDVVRRKMWTSAANTPQQKRTITVAWRHAQMRRIARCGLRLAGALLHRQWSIGWDRLRGLLVLLAQLLRSGPPTARRHHVEWTGRGV